MNLFKIFGSIVLNNSDANQALDDTSRKASTTAGKISSTLGRVGNTMSGIGAGLTKHITKPAIIAGTAVGGIVLAKGWSRMVEIDNAKVKLQAIGNSAEDVTKIMGNATTAVKGTAYGLDTAATAAASAVASGIEPGQQLERYLGNVADAAAVAGVGMDEMGSVFGKVTTTGKATNESLQQLAERGLPVYQWLGEASGKTADEIFKMASDGQVSLEMLQSAIETNIGGAAKTIGSQTINGAISNLWASVGRIGANFLGSADDANSFAGKVLPLLNDLKDWLGGVEDKVKEWGATFGDVFGAVVEYVSSGGKSFGELSDSAQKVFDTIQPGIDLIMFLAEKFDSLSPKMKLALGVGVLAAGPLISIIGKVFTVISGLISIVSAVAGGFTALAAVLGIGVGWLVLIVAAVVAAGILIYKNWDKIKEFAIQLWDKIKEVFAGIKEAIANAFNKVKETVTNVWNSIKNAVTEKVTAIKDTVVNIFNSVKETLENVWETIKNIIEVAIMLVVEIFTTAFDLITLPWRFIWENCKEYILAAWDAIKGAVTTAMDAIKTVISNIWDGIKTYISTMLNALKAMFSNMWNAIKTVITTYINAVKAVITTVWNAIKSVLSTVMGAIKTVISNIWNTIKTYIGNVLNGIKTTFSNIWNGIKTTVTNIIDGVKDKIKNGLDAAKDTITNILNGIKEKFSSIFEGAKNIVSGAIDKIKGYFNFSWSLPKIKLPHFNISGGFSLNPPSIPKFDIDWYAKAMNKGMILDQPTIFGINQNGQPMGAGEAGSETVVGTNSLMSMVRQASTEANQNSDIVKVLNQILATLVASDAKLYDTLIQALTDGVTWKWKDKEIGRIVRSYV